jgi:hypothetical protein
MKILLVNSFVLLLCAQIFGQVGINTTDPTATLDVNGTFRVRDMFPQGLQAIKLLGVDENGTLIQLNVDQNVYIDGDSVKATIIKEDIAIYPTINIEIFNDMPGIIWPGGTGNGRSYVRFDSSLEDLEITGIDISAFPTPLDAHGYTVSLYSVSGEIKIKNEDDGSLPQNRFRMKNGQIEVKQYETVKIMYDGYIERWLIVSKH